jgi:hypothetical protein
MAGALFHYKSGPASYLAAGQVLGGQLVSAAGTLTGAVAALSKIGVVPSASGDTTVLGVAGADANVGQYVYNSSGDIVFNATDLEYGPQGGPSFPAGWPGDGNLTTQDPLLDQSILGFSVPVYNNVDINVQYAATAQFGELLVAAANGAVTPYTSGTSTFDKVVGRCTQPGGVTVSSGTVLGRAFIRV